MKEFKLSDFVEKGHFDLNDKWIAYESVKEFIRLLKEILMNACDNKADGLLINQEIDKLAGDLK